MSREQATREALKSAFEGVLVAIPSSAVVLDYWAIGLQLNEWTGLLRPDQGDLVHGYMFQWNRLQQIVTTAEASHDTAVFLVSGVHSHTGRDSQNAFGLALEELAFALRPGALAVAGYGEVEHEGLQWDSIEVSDDLSSELLQVARGQIAFTFTVC